VSVGSIEERDKWIQACQQHAAYTEGEKETIPTRTFLSDKDMTVIIPTPTLRCYSPQSIHSFPISTRSFYFHHTLFSLLG
jgi:hypothetical protein